MLRGRTRRHTSWINCRVLYVCPYCRMPLDEAFGHAPARPVGALSCPNCGREYTVSDGIADFSEGRYYDNFDENTTLGTDHLAGLELETAGAKARIDDYYLPLIESRVGGKPRGEIRVLDSGCGNGLSVDLLARAGFDAWGHDLSALRKWQWRECERRDRLSVADALRLPFADGSFDFAISSGVIEHLGVAESGGATYRVEVLPSREVSRRDYVRELLRVVRPGGSLFIDAPNGAFPIDFWHGIKPGGIRWHWPGDGFLTTFAAVKRYAGAAGVSTVVRPLSPHRRLRFEQVGRHWYGRVFALPMAMLLRSMNSVPWLARSALNPYLVIEILKPLK